MLTGVTKHWAPIENNAKLLSLLYAACSLVLATLFCLLKPPFFGADELAHSERALEIAHGQWVATNAPIGSIVAELPDEVPPDNAPLPTRAVTANVPAYGAPMDTNFLLMAMRSTFIQRKFVADHPRWNLRPDGRFPLERLAELSTFHWSRDQKFTVFQNTAVYPPPLYFPSSLAWSAGEKTGMSILHTLYLARACNALCAIALGLVALRLAVRNRLIFFMFLLLPAVLNIEASCSQDALLIPLSVLLASLLTRTVSEERLYSGWELVVMALCLALLITARPPYLCLLVILFVPSLEMVAAPARKWLLPVCFLVVTVFVVAVWRVLVRPAGLSHSAVAQPRMQMLFIKAHPLKAIAIIAANMAANMPGIVVRGAAVLEAKSLLVTVAVYAAQILSFCIIVLLTRQLNLCRTRLLLVAALGAILMGLAFAEYIIWNAPGANGLDGVQARYLLPLLPFLFLLTFGKRQQTREDRAPVSYRSLQPLLTAAVVFCLAITFGTPLLLAHRYYDSGLVTALDHILK